MDEHDSKRLAKINFILLGIGSVISWASIVSTLDFFDSLFVGYDIYFYFPIPVFLAINLISLTIRSISNMLSINCLILSCQFVMCSLLVIIPLESYLWPNAFGFWMTMLFIFLLNLASSIMQCSCMALASIFPPDYIDFLNRFTGFGGIIITLVRGFFILIFAGGANKSAFHVATLFFFLLLSGFMLVSLLLHIIFIFSEHYRNTMKHYQRNYGNERAQSSPQQNQSVTNPLIIRSEEKIEMTFSIPRYSSSDTVNNPSRFARNRNNSNILNDDTPLSQPRSKLTLWCFVISKISKLFLLMLTINMQTFLVFPGEVASSPLPFFKESPYWNLTIIVLIHFIMETVGKYFAYLYVLVSLSKAAITVSLRFLICAAFIFYAQNVDVPFLPPSNIGILLGMVLFSFLHGYLTSSCFALGPELVNDEERMVSSYLMTFSLFFGTLLGALLALTVKDANTAV